MPPLSREEAHTAVKLFGSREGAARALGVASSTFRYWLDPEPHKERERQRYAADPMPQRTRHLNRYHGESEFERNRRRLKNRRVQALSRMAKRNQRREEAI